MCVCVCVCVCAFVCLVKSTAIHNELLLLHSNNHELLIYSVC